MQKQHENMIAIKRNQRRTETILAMKDLGSKMVDVSMRMKALNKGAETEQHAQELMNASEILYSWIDRLKNTGAK